MLDCVSIMSHECAQLLSHTEHSYVYLAYNTIAAIDLRNLGSMLPSLISRQQHQCSSSKRGGLSNLGPGDFKGVASFLVGNIKGQKTNL